MLELGAGTGRIADPLVQFGHDVTAVDDSDHMLAEVRHARTVRARIEDLQLPEKFDAVLLMTNLIHYRGVRLRQAVLSTVTHHLKPTGKAIIQWKPPSYWTARRSGWTECKTMGDVTARVTIDGNLDGLVDGEYALIVDGSELRQCHLEVLTVEELRRELDHAGLQLVNATPESTEWLEVVRLRPWPWAFPSTRSDPRAAEPARGAAGGGSARKLSREDASTQAASRVGRLTVGVTRSAGPELCSKRPATVGS